MTVLCPASVTTRSNSDLCSIDMILHDVTVSPAARMELIAALARDWDRGTTGTTGRATSVREAAARRPHLAFLL